MELAEIGKALRGLAVARDGEVGAGLLRGSGTIGTPAGGERKGEDKGAKYAIHGRIILASAMIVTLSPFVLSEVEASRSTNGREKS